MPTGIPYCDETWNPVVGCTKIASGCKYCWAERLHNQRHRALWGGKLLPAQYGKSFDKVQLLKRRLDIPLHWRKPRRIFVNSMSDTFHEDVPFEFIGKLFQVIDKCDRHTFQIFTKRFARMAEFCHESVLPIWTGRNKLPKNVHVFFSVSTQKELDKALPCLMSIPAAIRGFSFEPLVEPIWLPRSYCTECGVTTRDSHNQGCAYGSGGSCHCGKYLSYASVKLDALIVGSESGPNRRPCKLEWVRDIAWQCKEAGVCCYVKQLNIDGKVVTDPNLFTEDLRIREYPGKD